MKPAATARAKESLDNLGVDIDPNMEVRQLNMSEQQLTEIARVLTKNPKILLLISFLKLELLINESDVIKSYNIPLIYVCL